MRERWLPRRSSYRYFVFHCQPFVTGQPCDSYGVCVMCEQVRVLSPSGAYTNFWLTTMYVYIMILSWVLYCRCLCVCVCVCHVAVYHEFCLLLVVDHVAGLFFFASVIESSG